MASPEVAPARAAGASILTPDSGSAPDFGRINEGLGRRVRGRAARGYLVVDRAHRSGTRMPG
ncbi:hypothetical protein GCM10009639_54120 [Kitasatospora putterlickiae]|uniref:Uncharacterized protein n=1 Tax=Kitasatospora putterlickiae TaxID=221725 RepID=A0ABN1YDS2_9ACTN